jgi:hypothetical protein
MHGGLVLGTTAAMGASPSVARGGAVTTEGKPREERHRVVGSEGVDCHSVRSHLHRSQLVELALATTLHPYSTGLTNRAMVQVLAC